MDYGKLAYIKAEDIDKRLSLINSSVKTNRQCKLYFALKNQQIMSPSNNCVEQYFYIDNKTNVELQFDGVLSCETASVVTIEVLLNDAILTRRSLTVDGSRTSYSLGKMISNISQLNNSVKLRFVCASSVTLVSSMITVCGDNVRQFLQTLQIGYNAIGGTIGKIDIDGILTIFYNNAIDGNSLTVNVKPYEIKQFRLCYVDNILHIAYLTVAGKLYICMLSQLANDKQVLVGANITTFDVVERATNRLTAVYTCLGKVYSCDIVGGALQVSPPRLIDVVNCLEKAVAVNAATSGVNMALVIELRGKTMIVKGQGEGFVVDRTIDIVGAQSARLVDDNLEVYYKNGDLVNRCVVVVGQLTAPTKNAVRYCNKLIKMSDGKLLALDDGQVDIE